MTDLTSYVQAELKRRSGQKQLLIVAAVTGISRRTIGNVMDGKGCHIKKMEKLYEYLKANVRKKVLDEPPPTAAAVDRPEHDSEVGAVLG